MRRGALYLPIAGVACLALAGCGGSSSSSSTANPAGGPLTKAEYIEAADDVCNREHEEAIDFNERFKEAGDSGATVAERLAEAGTLLEEALPALEERAAELTGLEPPAADTRLIGTLTEKVEARIDVSKRLADALKGADLAEIRSLEAETKTLAAEAAGIAKGYGMKVCGTPIE